MTDALPNSPELTPRDGSGEMFDRIAERYDLLNRVISLGVDQAWRKRTVAALALPNGGLDASVVDLATGTGDLAIQIAQTYKHCQVVGIDPSNNMLEVGRRKLGATKLHERIQLLVGDAQALELDDNSVDGITMAFGIRNVPDRARALREMARITRPGRNVCILELSEPQRGLLSGLARFHMHSIVPWLGAVLSGEHEYRYLPQSIAAFPKPDAFCDMMRAAGLVGVQAQSLTFGVCHLFIGRVPEPTQPKGVA